MSARIRGTGQQIRTPDRWLWSATIITHHAPWLAGVMNDRTPVILPPERINARLDPELTDKAAAQKLISRSSVHLVPDLH